MKFIARIRRFFGLKVDAINNKIDDTEVVRCDNSGVEGACPDTLGEEPLPKVIILAVNYGLPLKVLIAACGYYYVDKGINADSFPTSDTGIKEFEFDIFHPNRDLSSDDAIREMKVNNNDPARPWEPAKIEHLLVLGKTYPEALQGFSIKALGSVAQIKGRRQSPCLSWTLRSHCLLLSWYDYINYSGTRYLRVRKKVSASVTPNSSVS
jgi:hypothetical protein